MCLVFCQNKYPLGDARTAITERLCSYRRHAVSLNSLAPTALQAEQVGLVRASTPNALQFMRNCPPAMVYTMPNDYRRVCKLNCVCPWCWMRRTVYVFNTLARCMHLPERGALATPVKLVEVSAQLVMSRVDAGSYLDNHFLRWSDCPKSVLRSIKPLGAFRMLSLAPTSVDGHKAAWRFSYRILAMVPKDWAMPTKLDNGYRKVKVTDVHSKKDLVNAVARTCRYPVGLLRGDPQMALTALTAIKNRRCSEFTGCFRQSGGSNDNDSRIGQKASGKAAEGRGD